MNQFKSGSQKSKLFFKLELRDLVKHDKKTNKVELQADFSDHKIKESSKNLV